MPLLDYNLSVLLRKLLRSGQLFDLEPLRLAQFNALLHIEHRFPSTPAHMDVNRPMIVTIEEEPIPILLEDVRHGRSM